MNKHLNDAIERIKELPEDRQEAAAALLLDFLDRDENIELTPSQIAEIERRLAEDDIVADAEVRAFFNRMESRRSSTSGVR